MGIYFTLQTSLTWFFSALRTSPKLLKKMKIVILLLTVLATINAAAVQNVKAADKPAAVKAADLPKPAAVEDLPKPAAVEDKPAAVEDKPAAVEDQPEPAAVEDLPEPAAVEDLPEAE